MVPLYCLERSFFGQWVAERPSMKSTVGLSDIELHDAVLNSVSMSIAGRRGEVDISVRKGLAGGGRQALSFELQSLDAFFARLDFDEMAEHARAGNVQDGTVSAEAKALFLHLVGGAMEATAAEIGLYEDPAQERNARALNRHGEQDIFAKVGDDELDFSYLDDLEFCPGARKVWLNMLLRAEPASSELSPAMLRFDEVSSCLAKVALADMTGDHRLGNVRSCTIDRSRRLIRLHLRRGFIEIVSQSAFVVRG